MNTPVLVLNQNYEPLNVCGPRRALALLGKGKAEILEHSRTPLRSARTSIQCPSVIRLVYMVKRPRPRVRLSRKEVFARDNYTCQYCGIRGKELTLDHVTPRIKGGRHTWDNLVTACRQCNHRKGSKTVVEARLTLKKMPVMPRVSSYYIIHSYLNTQSDWKKFIPEWEMNE